MSKYPLRASLSFVMVPDNLYSSPLKLLIEFIKIDVGK